MRLGRIDGKDGAAETKDFQSSKSVDRPTENDKDRTHNKKHGDILARPSEACTKLIGKSLLSEAVIGRCLVASESKCDVRKARYGWSCKRLDL